MPRAAIQLVVLLMAVPVQYFISQWTTPSNAEREKLLHQFSKTLSLLTGGVLEWRKWRDTLSKWNPWIDHTDDDRGECPANEVLNYVNKQGYYASSPKARSPRARHVKFRVGQVIQHKLHNYRGVIVGWDETLKAPDFWRNANHPSDKKHWKDMPNYAILVDVRDRPRSETTYIPEENIEILTDVKVMHDEIEDYFVGFDGAQYLPRPWLKKVYPHD